MYEFSNFMTVSHLLQVFHGMLILIFELLEVFIANIQFTPVGILNSPNDIATFCITSSDNRAMLAKNHKYSLNIWPNIWYEVMSNNCA